MGAEIVWFTSDGAEMGWFTCDGCGDGAVYL